MTQDSVLRIVLLGPPGAGKGTQGNILFHSLGRPHISTGAMLRDIGSTDTSLGRRVASLIDAGQYVGDEDMDAVLDVRLSQTDCLAGWILDGYPRRWSQAIRLDALAPPTLAIWLKLSEAEAAVRLAQRWSCPNGHIYGRKNYWPNNGICIYCQSRLTQRADDTTPNKISERIKIYRQITEPIISLYRPFQIARNRLLVINGGQPIHDVTKNILFGITTRFGISLKT